MVAMVQGNLLAVSASHWLFAGQTGLLAGGFATAALWVLGERRRWAIAGVLAVATVGADWVSHPRQFGGILTEAVITGLVAGALSLLVGRVIKRRAARKRRARR